MDHIVESSAVEDFDNWPSKKIIPDFLDLDRKLNGDPLTSMHLFELDRKLNSDPIPSPASPSIQKLSPIIELEDKQACEIDDDQQLHRSKLIHMTMSHKVNLSSICTFVSSILFIVILIHVSLIS